MCQILDQILTYIDKFIRRLYDVYRQFIWRFNYK